MAMAGQDAPLAPIVVGTYIEQRSRLSVAFRLILAIPHLILVYLGAIAAIIVAIVGWFAALVLGRLPARNKRFLSRYVKYFTRVTAYVWLLTDSYPPFNLDASDWAVDVEISSGNLNRLAVLFRLVLLFPAYIVWTVVVTGLSASLFFIWLIQLVIGRMPRALFDAVLAVLRFGTRFSAYGFMLSSAYPAGLLGDSTETTTPPMPIDHPRPTDLPTPSEATPPPPPIPASALSVPGVTERPPGHLVLTSTAKRIVVLFIVVGALSSIAQSAYYSIKDGELVLVVGFGRPPKIFGPLRERDAFFNANQALGTDVRQIQRTLGTCGTRPDPLRCAQGANREFVDALEGFDAAVARIDFPVQVEDLVLALRSVSTTFRNAINELIAATSDEEYFERVPAADEAGQAFDSAVIALGSALDRLVERGVG